MGNESTVLLSRTALFRHEAAFYAGLDEFVELATPFIREGLEAREPVLVLVGPSKIDALRSSLADDADAVMFGDMAEIGRNPARIIPVWEEFVGAREPDGRTVRGIGEPIWAGRSPDEIVEAQRHESLLNLAFAKAPAWILCPYDTATLGPAVLEEARRSHPYLSGSGSTIESTSYAGIDAASVPFDHPLPEPRGRPVETTIEPGGLAAVRRFVARHATSFGLDATRTSHLVLAANELATNSLRYATGPSTLRVWREGDVVLCEVRDNGRIADPLVGRMRPRHLDAGGLGLWLVNQVCDLVEVRSYSSGSVVRIRMSRA